MRSISAALALLVLQSARVASLSTIETNGHDQQSFDFVIIGGGTAGLVLAARLSEDRNVSVAVIEAGIHHVNDSLIDVPHLYGQALGNPNYDWDFSSQPQEVLNGSSLPLPRGKMLGGSSGLNFMAYQRASAVEYDAWEKFGNPGWNWKSLLPFFKRSETVSPPPPQGIYPGAHAPQSFTTFHGQSGLLHPSYNVEYSNIVTPYVQSVNKLGVKTNTDPYNGNAVGVYNTEATVDRRFGTRSYSASTYLNASSGRENLKVFSSSQATQIVFVNGKSLKAVGVDFVSGNKSSTLHARKEIIISAATKLLNFWNFPANSLSPGILLLVAHAPSGIGDSKRLTKLGINSLVDLPGVGENLQEHILALRDFTLDNAFMTFDEIRNNLTFMAEQQQEYNTSRTGYYVELNPAYTFAPLKSVASKSVFQAALQSAAKIAKSQSLSPMQKTQFSIQKDFLGRTDVAHVELIMSPGGGQTSIPPANQTDYISLASVVVHPFSRGSVHINSSDPLAAPIIDPRFLASDIDVKSFVSMGQFAKRITQTAPLAPNVVGPHDPPASVQSDEELFNYQKQNKKNTQSVHHPIGTAAMAARSLGGVVDPKLIVYGTTNLRVVDASIIPLHIACHPQATVYAIAERAASIIKQDMARQ